MRTTTTFFRHMLTALATFLLLGTTALAYSGDMSINSKDITFSSTNFLEGTAVRIYASATNNSNQDLLGVVRFYVNDRQIGSDQAISIFAEKTDGVFIDWIPGFGDNKVAVKIFPWNTAIDDPNNNWIVTNIFVVQDTDHDGIPNTTDTDDDGDGISDSDDHYPLNPNEQYDTDGDGIGDNKDTDDDNDGVPDTADDLPLDPDETTDTDKDGIGNIADTDDDGDSLEDNEEDKIGTDSLNPDTDGDTVNDSEDAFPLDPEEQYDTDGDGIGNNTDIDDDNDGIPDEQDDFPLNKGPVIQFTQEKRTLDLMKPYTFDASPSYDEDGEIISYLWQIDEDPREGNSITHTFKTKGIHNIKLTLTDNSGESRSTEFQVSILNLSLYTQLAITILLILLAMTIYIKYIADHEKGHTPTNL